MNPLMPRDERRQARDAKILTAAVALVRALEDLQAAVGAKPQAHIRAGLVEPAAEE